MAEVQSRRSGRARKQTEKFVAGEVKEAQADAAPTEGTGTKLGVSEHYAFYEKKLKSDHDLLKGLHSLCFGSTGKETTRKKLLRGFCGWGWSEDEADEKLNSKLKKLNASSKWTRPVLGELCTLLGLSSSGTKADVWTRVLEYLAEPTDVPLQEQGVKRKAAGSKGKPIKKAKRVKKAKKEGQPKRAMSSFILFSQAKRAEVKTNNPDMSNTDVVRELGRLWNLASDDEKAPFVELAAEDKERYLQEKEEFDNKGAAPAAEDEQEDEEDEE